MIKKPQNIGFNKFNDIKVLQNDGRFTKILITGLKQAQSLKDKGDKGYIFALPRNKTSALTNAESLLFTRLVSLSDRGNKSVTYSDQQAKAELGFSDSYAQKVFRSLRKKGFISSLGRISNNFGLNLRAIAVNKDFI